MTEDCTPKHKLGYLSPSRMEAFSDGVIAVIITIMVLDLHVPSLADAPSNHYALHAVAKRVLLYLLSFVQVGIYWVNHHYLLDDAEEVSHSVLWLNLLFLFFLSFFPFMTSWIGERGFTPFSVGLYSICSFLPSLAWIPMSALLARDDRPPVNKRGKELGSAALYIAAIAVSHFSPAAAVALLAIVAISWLLPPTRVIEARKASRDDAHASR